MTGGSGGIVPTGRITASRRRSRTSRPRCGRAASGRPTSRPSRRPTRTGSGACLTGDGADAAPGRARAAWTERPAARLDDAVAELATRGLRPAAVFVDGAFTSDGIFAPPPSYLRELVRRARAAGALYVADEVQAGYGRMGDGLWSFEAAGIVPDIVTLGKPMGNGHPVAAVITRADIVDRFAAETEFFSTFGGNPVACAAAMAVLDVIEDEGLTANAAVGRR